MLVLRRCGLCVILFDVVWCVCLFGCGVGRSVLCCVVCVAYCRVVYCVVVLLCVDCYVVFGFMLLCDVVLCLCVRVCGVGVFV